ncbi:hypothetical protein L2E82_32750 [Cichorium intybus]|uniref:Uncharacterized protein n=1 Tax=Cichorium intybus TaxID=13427 RepID=A0ACB9BGV8_CICIN|nr:hypothetical protein L2E82_32750 [Cichorium intybus]
MDDLVFWNVDLWKLLLSYLLCLFGKTVFGGDAVLWCAPSRSVGSGQYRVGIGDDDESGWFSSDNGWWY